MEIAAPEISLYFLWQEQNLKLKPHQFQRQREHEREEAERGREQNGREPALVE